MRIKKLNIPFRLRLKLKTRMYLLSAIVFAGFLFAAIMANSIISTVKIGSPLYQKIIAAKSSLEQFSLLKADLSQIRTESITLVNEPDRDKQTQIKHAIADLSAETNDKFTKIVQATTDEERKVAVQDAQSTWQEFSTTMNNELIPAVDRGDLALAKELATNIEKMRFNRFIDQIGGLVDILKLEIAELEKSTVASVRQKILISIASSGAIFLFVIISIILLTQAITRPMLKGIAFAKSVTEGNLAERIEVRNTDEIGELADSLNNMAGSLNSLVENIYGAADELSEVSSDIHDASKQVTNVTVLQGKGVHETSAAIKELNSSVNEVFQGIESLSASAADTSSSTMELARSLEEVALHLDSLVTSVDGVSSSINEMSATVIQTGENVRILLDDSNTTAASVHELYSSIQGVEANATNAATISNEVLRDAEMGRESVRATIIGMENIHLTSQITVEKVTSLSKKATDIGEILSVIDEVTEQTDLLALNAAIIAAQAGDHGKGFAVVASEIKELADRTRHSTRMIAEVIKGVQDETAEAVTAILANEGSIAEGEILSRKSGEALDKIVVGVQSSSSRINEIASATVEQAKGSLIINRAMHRVAELVLQISNATREQEMGNEMIMQAIELMKEANAEVRAVTQEQSKTGSAIARSTEQINDMTNRIKRACEAQVTISKKIMQTIGDIEQSTGTNLQATDILEGSVSRLFGQVKVLHHEMGAFKTKDRLHQGLADSDA